MKKLPKITEPESQNATAFRKQAEENALGKEATLPENLEAMSAEEIQQLLHELQVHQIELEMQKEELLRMHAELDAERTHYSDLYDLAPVGYYTISEKGLILEANLTAATLLGVARGALVKHLLTRFIFTKDRDIYYLHSKQLFETGEPQEFELRMINKDGSLFWAHLVATAVQTDETTPVCRVIINDITFHKLQAHEHEFTASLIELVNTPGDFRENMSDLAAALQGWSGCEAVGIRLRDEDDYPYYTTRGFAPEFVQAEKYLCAYGPDGKILHDGAGNPILECMCGNILCGRFDSAKPFFTASGSFWSNNTTALLANTTEADRQARTRNRCNGEGYESVALIPLRIGNQVFGLLQFNDRCTNRFTPDLVEHYERMADSLAISLSRRQAAEMLRETSDYLNRLIDYANAPIITWDTEYRITRFNHAFERLTGYTAEEVMGQDLSIFFPETSRDKSLNKIKATSLGEYWESVDIPIRCKDGVSRIVLWSSANIYAQDGKTLLATIAQGQDITDRMRAENDIRKMNADLEQRVIKRTAELEAVNKELLAFSYSVSHDLRAPLRSIDGFSRILLEDYQKNLDDKGKAFLEKVCKASQRMGLLIDDMLKLSKITQTELKREAVDLSVMIGVIAKEHQMSNPGRVFDVNIREGIMVKGDPHLINIAMENLVGNAFKFTGEKEHPKIEFGTIVRDGETACFIRDNGAGFEMAYVNKLFGAFQRLHTADEFPGTGIGLATVQRVINRHGGKIWAEGEKGKGA
ncbi:MAG: PAS domain S-box protein, partial [Proteobacteria bacterium]|nr:PAS domain S-box protein [Pseudomonadota bacterium]